MRGEPSGPGVHNAHKLWRETSPLRRGVGGPGPGRQISLKFLMIFLQECGILSIILASYISENFKEESL